MLLASQTAYLYLLFARDAETVTPAVNIGSHFIVNNLFVSGFILFFVHCYFWCAETMLVFNFVNLTTLYFRHNQTSFIIHCPVVAAPFAWNCIALFTNGAIMVNAHSQAVGILANVAIWAFLLHGLFFITTFQDSAMGVSTIVLVAGRACSAASFVMDWLILPL